MNSLFESRRDMADAEHTRAEIDEMAALLGGEVQQVHPHPDEQEVFLVLSKIRQLLLLATEEENVGVSQLANRLGVSVSAASRMVHREGDMRVSTAVLWARALSRVWNLELSKMERVGAERNFQAKWEVIPHPDGAESRSDTSHPPVKHFNSDAGKAAKVLVTKVGV